MELGLSEERRRAAERARHAMRVEAAAREVVRQRRWPVVQCAACGWFFPRWEMTARRGDGAGAHECLGCAADGERA